jgi:hypothetical protein
MTTYTLPLSSNTIDLLANSAGYNVTSNGVNFPGGITLTTNLSDPLPFDYYDLLAENAYNLAQSAYNYANTLAGSSSTDNVARQIALSAQANTIIIQGVDVAQNTAISIIQGVDVAQNSAISIIQGVDVAQNTAISIIQGVNVTQNTNIANKLSLTGVLDQTIAGNVTISGTTNIQQLNIAGSSFINTNRAITRYGTTHNVLGSGDGTRDIDLSLGNFVSANVTGITTWTFSNPLADPAATGFVLELTNGGSAALTWPLSVQWPGGTAPSLTAAGIDVLTFITDDGGTTYRGVVSMLDSKTPEEIPP